MTFLNALLALGTAAFTIPLIIHLLNRSRYLTIDWGAMHLLETSSRVNARRIQWKQWLLLLIRCMIPVLLALAMARPMVLSWKDSGAANAMALVVLLDDSMSMQSEISSEPSPPRTRWQRACDGLIQIAEQLPTGSSINLVLSGNPPESHPDLDAVSLKEILKQLRSRTGSAGTLELSKASALGIDWLNRSTQAKRHMLIISDFESSDWGVDSEPGRLELQQQLTQASTPVSASWIDVAGPPTTNATSVQSLVQKDIAMKSMEILPRHASEGCPLTISATLQNYSDVSTQVPVALFADVEEIERQSISIQPRSSVTCRFRWTPKNTGDTVLSVRAECDDGTMMDNSIIRVMRVGDAIRVLLVDGARSSEPMKSETDFLRVALTPFALLQGQQGDLFSTKVVTPDALANGMLMECDILVVCNAPNLTAEQLQWIRTYVEGGGGVIVAMGDAVQVDRYNEWPSISQGGIRPGILSPSKPWQGSVAVSDTPFFDLSPQVIESLNSIRFQSRRSITDVDSNGWIGFRFEDGEPWMISYDIGSGKCLWMLSSCDDGDSNFPARPAYLPVMQRLMLFANQAPEGVRCLGPGETWTNRWNVSDPASSRLLEWGRVGDTTATLPLTPAQGPRTGGTMAESRVSLPRLLGVVQGRVGSQLQKTMVDLTPLERNRELNRDRLSSSTFEALANQSGALPFTTVDDWMTQMRSRWSGRELWLWLWLGLVILVLTEMALQQSFRSRTIASTANVGLTTATSATSKGVA